MLVLSRHEGERIMIGDEIEIMVTEIRGDKVRIGIKAPANIEIHRREVYGNVQREKQSGDAA